MSAIREMTDSRSEARNAPSKPETPVPQGRGRNTGKRKKRKGEERNSLNLTRTLDQSCPTLALLTLWVKLFCVAELFSALWGIYLVAFPPPTS